MERDLFGSLHSSFWGVSNDLFSFVPEIVLALVVVIFGWIIGGWLSHVVERIFAKLKVNQALDAAGVDEITDRAGYKLEAGIFVGALVKWFIILVFFVAALDILRLDQVTIFFRDVVLGYLPRVIVAVLILLVAMVVANVASASVAAGARAAGFSAAELLASFTRYSILVFAVLAALSQLEIAPELVEILFMGIVFAASLAFGLAFGLGGKEAAARYIDKISRHSSGGDHHHHH